MPVVDSKRVHQVFLIGLGLSALALCLYIAQPFLAPLVAATALAVLCYPFHLRLLRRLRRPNLTAAVSVAWVVVVIVVPAMILAIILTREASDLYRLLAQKTSDRGGWTELSANTLHRGLSWIGVRSMDTEEQIREAIIARFKTMDSVLLRWGQALLANMVSLVVSATIALFALFFLFRDGPQLKRELERVLPLDPGVAKRLFSEVGQSVVANFYGIGAVALAQGTLTGIIFLALGLPSPVLWGSGAALFSMIPLVGPAIIWAPAALILAIAGSWGKAAILAAFGAGVISLADNFIRPYVISERVNLHPLLVFVALLGGAQAFGVLGLFIGPAAVTVAMAVFELLQPEPE
jgi:predicted PurR-regulated permease PerM